VEAAVTDEGASQSPDSPDPIRRELLPYANQGSRDGRIIEGDWAGGIREEYARIPSVRLRNTWISVLWLIPIIIVGLVMAIAVAQQLRTYEWMQTFLRNYPGTSSDYVPAVTSGYPWWLRWQHFFNLVFMLFIIRAGLQILADHPRLYFDAGSRPGTEWLRMRGPVPPDRMDSDKPREVWTAKDDSVALPKWLGLPGMRHTIGLARWWHFSFDLLWLVNGLVFYILLFSTGQWARLVPRSWDVLPNALSTAVQYASLDLPANEGFTQYNGMQLTAYFLTVFVAAPLAFITGLLQSPAIAAKLGLGSGVLNRQVARTIHFWVLCWMIFFIAVHTLMVWITGLLGNINHITLGTNTQSWWGLIIYGFGMLVVVGLWAAASPFTIRHPRRVQTAGRFMVGRVKALMEWWDPRATYSEKDISPYFWSNGELPESQEYEQLRQGGFADYRLRLDGLVEHPVEISYADLRAMPKREQITQHYCIQGWSGIAKWGGVAMADLLAIVKPKPEAKWVVFYSFADGPVGGRYYDCHRIENMHHELTILAYEMNGESLNESHGAPLRLRDEAELGFKQVKWVQAVEFVADFDHLGAGQGGYNEDQEFYGYRMPI
jgi:methionine sulfoxide reductase catalytic subunit